MVRRRATSYFGDDFSWVTDVYGETDCIGTYPTPLTASIQGAGSIEGAQNGVLSFPLSRGNAWEGFSFTVTGADATTRVVFAPATKSKNRVQFDNFRAESLTR